MTSAQENNETGENSNAIERISPQENESSYRSFPDESLKEKPEFGMEKINKASVDAGAVKSDYAETEQSKPPAESPTKTSSHEKFGLQSENVVRSSSPERLSLPLEGMMGKVSSVRQFNLDLGSERVNGEALVEEQDVCIKNVENGLAETSREESSCLGRERPGPSPKDLTRNSDERKLKLTPKDENKSSMENSELPLEDEDEKKLGSVPKDEKKPSLEHSELPPENEDEEKPKPIPEDEKEPNLEHLGLPPKDENEEERRSTAKDEKNPSLEHLGLPPEEEDEEKLRPAPEDKKNPSLGHWGLLPEDEAANTNLEELEPQPANMSENYNENVMQSAENAGNSSVKSRGKSRNISAKSTRAKYSLRGNPRVLRSRSQEKSKALGPTINMAEQNASGEKTRKRRKKKRTKKVPGNEFARIRTHMRYLMNRMGYEQNLIDAYSGEGWKGQSIEKVKLEKEIQRAKSEIIRTKLKIRDLFQRLDSSIAVGRLPEYLFDSEGEIDSDDIFCAKCGSKDLSADNDIILCDGACERGFHQFCLDPPLLKEDIPPDDKGWLCPGCDCKVDCICLLNDSQGTNLSVLDSWEKVFPEAAASGKKLADNAEYPSDDSQDNDYEPDGLDVDEEMGGDESNSDESKFYSASDGTGASPDKKPKLVDLSSDDSEDDDYDPDAPDLDEQIKAESSSSDFTSDSENFDVTLADNQPDGALPGEPASISSDRMKPYRGYDGEKSEVAQRKIWSLNDELLSLKESDPGQADSSHLSGKRYVERLDYKKLHDDTYGNVSSDSSDEDWMDAIDGSTRRRKNNGTKVDSTSPNGRTSGIKVTNSRYVKQNQEDRAHTPKRKTRKKLDIEGTNDLPSTSNKDSSEPVSGRNTKKSASRRLGEAVTQRLLKSFMENQYPERASKENLAKELGITLRQVSKWFENARWSFHHSSLMESVSVESAPDKGSPLGKDVSKSRQEVVAKGPDCKGGNVTIGKSLDQESGGKRSTIPRNRKRKGYQDRLTSDQAPSVEDMAEQTAPVDLPKSPEKRKRGRPKKSKAPA